MLLSLFIIEPNSLLPVSIVCNVPVSIFKAQQTHRGQHHFERVDNPERNEVMSTSRNTQSRLKLVVLENLILRKRPLFDAVLSQ